MFYGNISVWGSVKENINDKFDIFPNPAVSFLKIINKENQIIHDIAIINSQGHSIPISFDFNLINVIEVDVENLPVGYYILRISANSQIFHFKFIKL